tara:strand:- start:354 stop:1007 length:654 start_codon:yes stop_codon:yes gene_type:complete
MYKSYIIIIISILFSNENDLDKFNISRIQYDGGGDWYADPSSLTNLLDYINKNTMISTAEKNLNVKIGDENFNKSQYLYITGHGNIRFSNKEIALMRDHLLNGGFLHADDNYGMDKSFRKIVGSLFPEKKLIEIPPSHSIFNCFYKFPNGLPKIHEHDNQRPQALGVFENNRLLILYTFESDLGDGWEDKRVHNVSDEKRERALQMGTNIVIHALTQ